MPTCGKCGEEFSNRVVVNGKKVNFGGRRKFCLVCSPYGTKNRLNLGAENPTEKRCPMCEKVKSLDDFYLRAGKRKGPGSYCKDCHNKLSAVAKRKWKQSALGYVGEFKCSRCGYDKHVECLDFHHHDPTVKEFGFGNRKGKLTEGDKVELRKTVVVCCRCHREIHIEMSR